MTELVAELTAVRHGQSVANAAFATAAAAGRLDAGLRGRGADDELSPLGRTQSVALGWALAARPPVVAAPEIVVSSPYLRARQTWEFARGAAADHGLDLPAAAIDPRLHDRLMGRWERMTPAAIAARFPEQYARGLGAGQWHQRPPDGETFSDVTARVAAALADLHRDHPGRRVLLVAHDAVVLMLRRVIEGLTFDNLTAVTAAGPVRNAAITRFTRADDRLVLAEYNTPVAPVQT